MLGEVCLAGVRVGRAGGEGGDEREEAPKSATEEDDVIA